MRWIVIALLMSYLLAAIIGCLDRGCSARNTATRENSHEIILEDNGRRRGGRDAGGGIHDMVERDRGFADGFFGTNQHFGRPNHRARPGTVGLDDIEG